MSRLESTMMEALPWIDKKDDLPGVMITDTTSRDGLQSLPWWNYWNKHERGSLSVKMADLGIHHLELGFPAVVGDPEYDSVRYSAAQVGERESVVMGLARLVESDITNAIESIQGAKYKGIHTFVGTSPEHLSTFSFSENDILENVRSRVEQIRSAGLIAQFSAEDATRTPVDLLITIYEEAVKAGAQILNIPDTLGYYDVLQYLELMEILKDKFPNVILSTHTHNDKSQAEQSALMAVLQGYAQRIEGTIFGIGERCGNADWAQLITFIRNDQQRYGGMALNILKDPELFGDVLNHMRDISGIHMRNVAPGYGYEAIVNRSGIHQAKVAKLKEAYIWNDDSGLGIGERPEKDISALSGYNGVTMKFKEDFGIEVTKEMAIELTEIYRFVFSPDTTIGSLHEKFPAFSNDFLSGIDIKVKKVKKEAREMRNTKENLQKWGEISDQIILEIYNEYNSNQ